MNHSAVGPGSEQAPSFQVHLPQQLAQMSLSFPAFADAFAREVAQLYVSGQITFEHGDNAIGWLNGYSLTGPHGDLLDGFAWQVYRAFDAGEYHPAGSSLGEDLPARHTLPRLRQLLASAAA